MDILFLSQYFYPENFLNNHIARALVRAGHRVNVICCVPNYPAGEFFPGYSNKLRKDENWQGIKIHRAFTIARGRRPWQLVANYLTYPVAASWRILRMGKTRGNISFVSMPSPLFQALAGIFAKKIWRIPTVYWVQDIWPDSAIITLGIQNRGMIRLLNAICGWIYRQADLIMVQSDGFHEKIAAFGVPSKRILTLPNPAPELFHPISLADVPQHIREKIPTDRPVLMFAGNIGRSQDFDSLIAGVKLLPDSVPFLLVVIGSGRDEARVKAMVNSQGVGHRFLFLGRHQEADMPAFFACAGAMLVSLRDEPIFSLTIPSKIQAYMACGKPIFASLAGVGSAIIEAAQAGMCISPSDPSQLAKMFEEFATMRADDLDAFGKNARAAYEEQYSLERIVGQLETKLKEAVNAVPDN